MGDNILKIYIGCDHRGVQLKEKVIHYLKENELDVEDIGLSNVILTKRKQGYIIL